MKPENTRLIPAEELKPNPWRHYLGEIKSEDVEVLEESIYEKDLGWWDGIVGRQMADGNVEQANGHRRVAALLEDGKTRKGIHVRIYPYSDAQMLQVLAQSNTFKVSTEEERIGTVKAALVCLTTKPEECRKVMPNSASSKWGNVGPSIVSQFLGEKAWPRQRVSEIMEVISEREAQANQPVHQDSVDNQNRATVFPVEGGESTETEGQPVLSSPGQLVDNVLADVERKLEKKPESGSAPKPIPLTGQELVLDRLEKVKTLVRGDLEKRLDNSLHDLYLRGFKDFYLKVTNA